jgi:Tfp pilus assembly protein PilW
MSKKKNGFTLIELQIAACISLITIAAAISLYLFYWRTFVIGNAALDVYSNSRIAIGLMARDIRCASQVVTNHGSYTTSNNTLVLQTPSINANGDTIPSHYDFITYKLQGSDLYKIAEVDASSARPAQNSAVAHYCTSLAFSSGGVGLSHISNLSTINTVAVYLPLNKVTVSISGAGTGNASISPTTIIRMRNK